MSCARTCMLCILPMTMHDNVCIRGSSGCVPPPFLGRPQHPRELIKSPELWAHASTSCSAREQAASVDPLSSCAPPSFFGRPKHTWLSVESPESWTYTSTSPPGKQACSIQRARMQHPLSLVAVHPHHFSVVLDTLGSRSSHASFGYTPPQVPRRASEASGDH